MSAQEDLRDLVEFRTDRFTPFLPEDSQVNPGVYGAELAYWLAQRLASRGVVTSYPEYEDWGWYLNYATTEGAEFAIHCANVEGTRNQWLLTLRRHSRKLFGRGKPSFEMASVLVSAIHEVLIEGEIEIQAWHPSFAD